MELTVMDLDKEQRPVKSAGSVTHRPNNQNYREDRWECHACCVCVCVYLCVYTVVKMLDQWRYALNYTYYTMLFYYMRCDVGLVRFGQW